MGFPDDIKSQSIPEITEGDRPDDLVMAEGSYGSVSEMVRDLSEPDFADDFDRYRSERQLVNALSIVRCLKGLSQADIATRMDCAQSKVSRIESSPDAEMSFGDFLGYAMALDRSIHLEILPMARNGADHIRFHVESIKHELNSLFKVAGNDQTIEEGVGDLAVETVRNMLSLIDGLIEKLPHKYQSDIPIRVEAQGEQGRRLDLDIRKKVRKKRSDAITAT